MQNIVNQIFTNGASSSSENDDNWESSSKLDNRNENGDPRK